MRTAIRMIYRDHREYEKPPRGQEHDILRSWLRGEAGLDSLRSWLSAFAS